MIAYISKINFITFKLLQVFASSKALDWSFLPKRNFYNSCLVDITAWFQSPTDKINIACTLSLNKLKTLSNANNIIAIYHLLNMLQLKNVIQFFWLHHQSFIQPPSYAACIQVFSTTSLRYLTCVCSLSQISVKILLNFALVGYYIAECQCREKHDCDGSKLLPVSNLRCFAYMRLDATKPIVVSIISRYSIESTETNLQRLDGAQIYLDLVIDCRSLAVSS